MMYTGTRPAIADPDMGEDGTRARLTAGLPVTERRLRIAGISTALLEGGDGPPILLLHGPGESAVNWRWIIPDLAATHHVIAPDLPAHGSSGVPEGEPTAELVLDWLGQLIDRTCPEPPVVVGHVIGGAIAARFAAADGQRIRRLVLVDSLGLSAFRPSPRFALTMAGFLMYPTEGTYERFMNQCAYDLDGLRREMGADWEAFVSYNLSSARSPASKTAGKIFRQVGLPQIPPEDLARIAVPTDLVWGRHDRANRLPVAEAAARRFGWPLHVIENAADDPQRDQPDAFLKVLRSVLEQDVSITNEKEEIMTTIHQPALTPEVAQTQAAWDAIAPGYDRFVTPSGDWALPEKALRLAGLRAGMRFLDVASGSGALSIPAARLGAEVMAVDLSPEMIARLRARAGEEGLSLEARVMDGHALDLADDRFDVSGSQFGVMLFPDLPRALGEMVRVTKPGGRVVMVAYGPPPHVEFLTIFMGAMHEVVEGFQGLPDDPPPLPFQVADPEVLRHRMSGAGLSDVRIESAKERLEFASGQAMWDWVVNSNPIAAGLVADLDEKQRSAVREKLDTALRERSGGGTAVLENAVHIAIGTK
jgi:pimeloyl-ACP methyl ester carboxylesterase/ubiquinone/menaquinone biosynthesis C-methylase UbiE